MHDVHHHGRYGPDYGNPDMVSPEVCDITPLHVQHHVAQAPCSPLPRIGCYILTSRTCSEHGRCQESLPKCAPVAFTCWWWVASHVLLASCGWQVYVLSWFWLAGGNKCRGRKCSAGKMMGGSPTMASPACTGCCCGHGVPS